MTEEVLEAFHLSEMERIGKLHSIKHKEGFPNKSSFQTWYIMQLVKQKYKCFYCETSIFEIKKLIESGKLMARNIGYGQRGPVLEIDKMQNSRGYNPDNCVLSCLYCNNDKSSTLESAIYKEYFGPARHAFFQKLLSTI